MNKKTQKNAKNIQKKSFFQRNKSELKSYLILAFPIIWFCLFFVVGFFRGLYFSMTDYDGRFVELRGVNFVLFKNYIAVFKDKIALQGIKNSLLWTVVMLIGNNFFGLLTAVLIGGLRRGKGVFLAGLFWPTLVSATVGTQVTLYLFRPTSDGVMNIITSLFGSPPRAWLIDAKTSMFSLMLLPFFLGFSMKMLIYYAGLKGIPATYYESAALETNSSLEKFWHITLPLLSPVIFLNVILSVMDGFKIIAPMQLVTPDNPDTVSIVYYLYTEAFNKTKIGYASAIGFLLFVLIMAMTLIQNKIKRESVVYE